MPPPLQAVTCRHSRSKIWLIFGHGLKRLRDLDLSIFKWGHGSPVLCGSFPPIFSSLCLSVLDLGPGTGPRERERERDWDDRHTLNAPALRRRVMMTIDYATGPHCNIWQVYADRRVVSLGNGRWWVQRRWRGTAVEVVVLPTVSEREMSRMLSQITTQKTITKL